jgi:excisionase family DNA binding protein
MPDDLELLTVKEAASYLSLTEDTVRSSCRRGDLKAHKVNRRWRIPRENLNAYLYGDQQTDVNTNQEKHQDGKQPDQSDEDSLETFSDIPF